MISNGNEMEWNFHFCFLFAMDKNGMMTTFYFYAWYDIIGSQKIKRKIKSIDPFYHFHDGRIPIPTIVAMLIPIAIT